MIDFFSHSGGHEHHHHIHHDVSKKGLGLKEIFEIALTTLAFLAFGMFTLQVIMCITMDHATATDPNMMVTPMEGSAELDPVTEEVRKRRAVPVGRLAHINQLAKVVLTSIDATFEADQDHGQCLYRTLCEVNKLSLKADRNKYWIPLWGLGMTWFSPRVVKQQPRMHSIIDGLKASLLGLGNADCARSFSKCNYQLHRDAKERRRKRRSAADIHRFGWH